MREHPHSAFPVRHDLRSTAHSTGQRFLQSAVLQPGHSLPCARAPHAASSAPTSAPRAEHSGSLESGSSQSSSVHGSVAERAAPPQPGGPPTSASDPARGEARFAMQRLHRQLDSFHPSALFLSRFHLLNKRHRRQGGAPSPHASVQHIASACATHGAALTSHVNVRMRSMQRRFVRPASASSAPTGAPVAARRHGRAHPGACILEAGSPATIIGCLLVAELQT